MTLNQAFAIRVRALLKEKGKTQYRLEQDTGLYHSTMTAILGNKVKASNFRSAVFIEKPQVSDWADKLAGRPEPCLTKRAARR